MTDLDLAAIEARANGAGDEPWIVVHEPAWEADGVQHPDVIKVGAPLYVGDDEPVTICLVSTDYEDDPVDVLGDAEFIAHARTDVPALVAALREARAEVERLRGPFPCCEHCVEYPDDDPHLDGVKDQHDLPCQICESWRDDWRRRYEALRDGVTGLHFRDARGGCASCIDPDGFSVWWPCETAAVVARVEGDES